MKYVSYVEVRTYELDSYNHVNNAVYLNYLEYARMDFLKQIGFDYNGLFEEGYMLFVSHIDIKYKFSARLYEKLSIEVVPIKFGKLSGKFLQTVKNEQGITCVEAEVTWCCVDKNGKPAKLPEKYIVGGLQPEKN